MTAKEKTETDWGEAPGDTGLQKKLLCFVLVWFSPRQVGAMEGLKEARVWLSLEIDTGRQGDELSVGVTGLPEDPADSSPNTVLRVQLVPSENLEEQGL